MTILHEHIWLFHRHYDFEDEELYRLSDGRHGGPVDEYRCAACRAREYR